MRASYVPVEEPGENARGLGATALRLLLLNAVYFAVAAGSFATFGLLTPIWFANGIAVAWLLSERQRTWPAALASLWVTDSAAFAAVLGAPAAIGAVADVVEVALAATLIRGLGGGAAALRSLSGLIGLIAVSLGVPIISASIGAALYWWSDGAAFVPGMVKWYAASALGLLILCPTLLIWTTPGILPKPDSRSALHSMAGTAALAGLSYLIFHQSSAAYLFVTFPALLLLVWHSGLFGASLGTAVLLGMGIVHVFHGDTALATMVYPQTDMAAQVHAFQVYLVAVSLSSLPLAVVLTAQREMSRQLGRVAEARRDFLAAMSHEIRTPMTGVLGIVDLMDDEPLSQRQRAYIEKIRVSGRHLLNIINDVLDFSRIESGRIELEQVDFSIPQLLESVRSLLHPLAVERGIAFRFDLTPHSPPVVRGDPTRLRQVLLNLTANAIKFTHDGSVTVAVSCQGGDELRFRFVVQDTGIGIDADKQSELFKAFTQADRTTRRRYGGSGLGLAISKRLVDAMGGEIGVSSVVGAGSVFWFEIPLERGDPAALATAAAAEAGPLTPCRILLAEDVELNRDIVTTMLERDGHEVTIAHNGRQALVQAQMSRFDLILMDVHMPVMDGIEATRRIRALSGSAGRTPIVALTANVMAAEQERCIGAGMDAVLIKPMDWDRVRAAIRQFGTPAGRGGANGGGLPVTGADRNGVSAGRNNVTHARENGGSGDGEPAFSEETLARLKEILPPDRLKAHAESLDADVARLAAASTLDPMDSIRGTAHKIVSQAGMLGLLRLSSRAAEVEQACWDEERLCDALERFREAAEDPRATLGELIGQP